MADSLEKRVNEDRQLDTVGMMYSFLGEAGLYDKAVISGGQEQADSRGKITYGRAMAEYIRGEYAKTYGPNSLAARIGSADTQVLAGTWLGRYKSLSVSDVFNLAKYLKVPDIEQYEILIQNKEVASANYKNLMESLKKKAEKGGEAGAKAGALFDLVRTLQSAIFANVQHRAEASANSMTAYHAATMVKAASAPKDSPKYRAFKELIESNEKNEKAEKFEKEQLPGILKTLGLDHDSYVKATYAKAA